MDYGRLSKWQSFDERFKMLCNYCHEIKFCHFAMNLCDECYMKEYHPESVDIEPKQTGFWRVLFGW
jgi:hypothetical protein